MTTDLALDAAARVRALDPSASFIVQAPAGAGKTELLIQRVLALLATVRAPEEILAVTFTRKAVAEMRGRVLAALASATDPEPAAPHTRRTWHLAGAALAADARHGWKLRENPSRLSIRTIDAVAVELARQLPLTAGFGAVPAIVDDAHALYREAARRTVHLAEEHPAVPAVIALLAHVGHRPSRLIDLLAGLLAHRDQWLRHLAIGTDMAAARTRLESTLARLVTRTLAAARAALPTALIPEIVELARGAGAAVLASGLETPLVVLATLTELPGDAPEARPLWQALTTLLLTEAGQWRRTVDKRLGFPAAARARIAHAGKSRMIALLAALSERGDSAPLAAVRSLPPPRYSDAQWDTLAALVTALPAAAEELKTVFREHATVDFVEMTRAARAALGTDDAPTDLLLALDRTIQHILVDEFQDTSRTQWALLRQLTAGWEPGDGRTLFLVGDPMQSIYSFREADVRLFLQAQARDATMLQTLDVTPLRLVANFRSTPAIVTWMNQIFGLVLPDLADIAAGAVPFSAAVPARTDSSSSASSPVSLHHTRDDPDVEAKAIVDIVLRTRADEPTATIGILGRAREHLSAIVRALTRAGVRYRAEALDTLAERPIILDLLALTRAILHPLDRIAWLTCLRAPWCGLTLADLHLLVGDRPQIPCMDILDEEIRLAALGPDARAHCIRLREVFRAALAARGRRRLRDLVEGTWIALGGPACVGEEALTDVEDFLELLGRVEGERTITGAEIIEERLSRLFARADSAADDSVQIMTIHKSKGLEFDIVIIPGLGRGVRGDAPSILGWREHEDGLLLAPLVSEHAPREDPLYALVQRLTARAQHHETGRLLYVAATRARRELHLFDTTDTDDGPRRGSFLDHLWPAIGKDLAARREHVDLTPARPPSSRLDASLRRLPSTWAMPQASPDVIAPEAPLPSGEGEPISFRWVGETARRVGTVVHDLICRIAQDGVERWPNARLGAMRPSVAAALAVQGVPAGECKAAAARALGIVERALGDTRGRWLLSRHRDAASELAMSGIVDGRLHHARLDRTFVDETGVRWIIDIKTSAHEGAGLDAFLDGERERYRSELERYGTIMAALDHGRGTPRPIRFALYYPDIPEWREWAAE